jgi:hypothetical protein
MAQKAWLNTPAFFCYKEKSNKDSKRSSLSTQASFLLYCKHETGWKKLRINPLEWFLHLSLQKK